MKKLVSQLGDDLRKEGDAALRERLEELADKAKNEQTRRFWQEIKRAVCGAEEEDKDEQT